jgi:hypothetical protein
MTCHIYEILDRYELDKDLDYIFEGKWRYYKVNNVLTTKKIENFTKLKYLGTIERDLNV